jgi:hypothetical protein
MMANSALSDFTKMPVMPKLPKTAALVQPKPTPEGMIGPAEVGPVLSELGSEEAKASLAVGQRDIDIEQAKRDERATEARMKAENLATFAEEVKAMPERKTLEQARQEMSDMAFVPTKDTATDLAAMFSLINIVGMLVGKSDAQRSMFAMNGMLEGYQKGRADLYKREQIEFDKNFKAMQAKVATLEKALTEAMEVKKYDKERGDLMVTMALAQAESQVLKYMRERQGDVAVLENVRKARKDVDTLVGLNNTLVKNANDRADAAERERRADIRAKLARDQALALAAAKGEKGGKAPAKEIVNQNQLRNTLIPKLQEVVPIMDRLHKEGKWNTLTSLLAIDPRVAEAEFKNDEEALKAIRTFAYFRSKEFETAGKALTRKEDAILAPIYRSDFRVYQGARGAILDGLKTMQQEQAGLEGMYPYIKEYNQILRGETPQEIDINKERELAYEAIQAGYDINDVKKMFKQETGESLVYGEE